MAEYYDAFDDEGGLAGGGRSRRKNTYIRALKQWRRENGRDGAALDAAGIRGMRKMKMMLAPRRGTQSHREVMAIKRRLDRQNRRKNSGSGGRKRKSGSRKRKSGGRKRKSGRR